MSCHFIVYLYTLATLLLMYFPSFSSCRGHVSIVDNILILSVAAADTAVAPTDAVSDAAAVVFNMKQMLLP